jgi:hypothetical protein
MECKLKNPDGSLYHSVVLATWNVNQASFDGVFLDVHSFDGFDPMNGSGVKSLSSDRTLTEDHQVKRIWGGSITMPRMASMAEGAAPQLVGVDRKSTKLVEHKISDSEWVLVGIMTDGDGKEFVGLEWTFTKGHGPKDQAA